MKVNIIVDTQKRIGHAVGALELRDELERRGIEVTISKNYKRDHVNHAHINGPFLEPRTIEADLYTIYGPVGFTLKSISEIIRYAPSPISKFTTCGLAKALMYQLPFKIGFSKLDEKRIIVTCDYIKRHLESHFTVNYLRVIHPGIRLPAPQKDYGLNRKQVIFTGKNFRQRGDVEVLRATKILKDEFSDLKIIIANQNYDKFKNRYARIVKEYGIGDRVSFFGRLTRDEIFSLIQESSIGLYPYLVEQGPTAVPFSLLETMACGKPVVSTRVGAIPEILENGRAGIIIPPGDVQALANNIRKLLSDENLYRKYARNARKRIEKEYNVKHTTDEYLKAYAILR